MQHVQFYLVYSQMCANGKSIWPNQLYYIPSGQLQYTYVSDVERKLVNKQLQYNIQIDSSTTHVVFNILKDIRHYTIQIRYNSFCCSNALCRCIHLAEYIPTVIYNVSLTMYSILTIEGNNSVKLAVLS